MTRLAVVLGSIRPNRVGAAIAQWVVDKAGTVEGVQAELVDLASFDLPLFVEEVPPMMAAPKHPAAVAWNETIASYDAIVVVTPEYNRSVPGALKNAIDFLVPAALARKGVGLVGYSYSGGIRPMEHLRQILANFDTDVVAPQVSLNLATDISEGVFTPAAYHDGEVPAMVQAVVARSGALAPLR